jgi:transcriptional regulatory protein RtcR
LNADALQTPARRLVVIGLLGSSLDAGLDTGRWERWRPTVAMCAFDDMRVDRVELLSQPHFQVLRDQVISDLAAVSPETEVRSHAFLCEDPWDFEEVYAVLHDFARTYPFDTDREDYLIHITTGTHVAQICLFLLTEARYLPAKILQTSPPSQRDSARVVNQTERRIIDLDLSRYDRIATRFHQEKDERLSFLKFGIATKNAPFNRLIEKIERVALASTSPLLLFGPTGAGKTRLAKRIYELKRAKHQVKGPYVEVNCATLRGEQAMSALFGHVKGAFTGAVNARDGLLRTANDGVLFLDEIGELGLDEQAMLLKAIETGTFLPVGSDKEVTSRFQLLAGTNRDLWLWVAQGRFREDLLARINLWTFDLPGLRERPEDIEPNLDFEIEQFCQRHGNAIRFNKEARDRFLGFATEQKSLWRGNFRELSGAVERMCTLSPAGRITLESVEEEVTRLMRGWYPKHPTQPTASSIQATPSPPITSHSHPPTAPLTHDETPDLTALLTQDQIDNLDLFDQIQLREVLKICRSCKSLSEAGRTLFGVSRTQKAITNDADRLRKFLSRFGLDWKRIKSFYSQTPDP